MTNFYFIKKRYLAIFLAPIILLNGCETPEGYTRQEKTTTGQTIYNTDYKAAIEPIINAFRYLKNVTLITESQREGYSVTNLKYYQDGKYTMRAHYSEGMFVLSSIENALDKDRIAKHLDRVGRSYLIKELKTYRSDETYALYAKSGDCAVISFATKVKMATYDNDQGNPDLLGMYSGCRGLTVSPLEFVQNLALANPSDEALYATFRDSKSPIASKRPKRTTSDQEMISPAKMTREQEKNDAVVNATDIKGLCFLAVEGSGASLRWSNKNSNFAGEARRRGMTLSSCAALLSNPGSPGN